MTRPLILLPPAKKKAPGGEGPAYGRVLTARHPLSAPRREVLAALGPAAAALDDRGVARVCGVRVADVAAAREQLRQAGDAPTLPAHRRYRGVVHDNAGLAGIDPTSLEVEIRVVSALLGLAAPDDPVPPYRLEFAASLAPLGGLAGWWRDRLGPELRRVAGTGRVWDLLPGEHRRVWTPQVRGELDVIDVRFVRPDGRPANAATTKVAKGHLTAWLLAHAQASEFDAAAEADLGAAWRLAATRGVLTATHLPPRTSR